MEGPFIISSLPPSGLSAHRRFSLFAFHLNPGTLDSLNPGGTSLLEVTLINSNTVAIRLNIIPYIKDDFRGYLMGILNTPYVITIPWSPLFFRSAANSIY